eukprot:6273109-Prymnesium_polylepis.2
MHVRDVDIDLRYLEAGGGAWRTHIELEDITTTTRAQSAKPKRHTARPRPACRAGTWTHYTRVERRTENPQCMNGTGTRSHAACGSGPRRGVRSTA